jgi:hypothetical protein
MLGKELSTMWYPHIMAPFGPAFMFLAVSVTSARRVR